MKLSINKKTPKKGFTLIELLVVIAIIATLGGLSYGPIMRHLQSADLLKAKKICKDLTSAIDMFEQEYDSLPYTGTYPSDDENVVTDVTAFLDVLMGVDTDINDRGKKFFTADQAQGEKDGMVYSGANLVKLVDKWGNPYTIRLDYSADDEIDASQIGPDYSDKLRIEGAIAASPGPDNTFNDKQDAKSW